MAYFFLIPGISAVAPLLALPAITSSFGLSGWSSVAIGLSFGMAGATIVELGWSVTGPQAVARGLKDDRRSIFYTALATKLVASIAVVPGVALLSYFVATSFRWEAALLAAASTLSSLGTSWYFVGLARPLVILFTDTLPRVLLLVAAAIIIGLGGSLFAYPLSIALAAVVCLVAGSRVAGMKPWPAARYVRDTPAAIRGQLVVIVGRVISTGYTALTVALVAVVAPPAVAVFAAVERVMRMGLAFLAGYPNRLQAWLGSARSPQELLLRIRMTIITNSILGLAAGAVFAAVCPAVIRFLFDGQIAIGLEIAIAGGLVVVFICISRGLGLALIAMRQPGSVTIAIAASCAIGVPLLLLLPPAFGSLGAVAAVLAAEVVGAVAQSVMLMIARRRQHDR